MMYDIHKKNKYRLNECKNVLGVYSFGERHATLDDRRCTLKLILVHFDCLCLTILCVCVKIDKTKPNKWLLIINGWICVPEILGCFKKITPSLWVLFFGIRVLSTIPFWIMLMQAFCYQLFYKPKIEADWAIANTPSKFRRKKELIQMERGTSFCYRAYTHSTSVQR